MLKHDIELPSKIPELLLEKHVKYLVSYGTDKDEYVRMQFDLLHKDIKIINDRNTFL